MAERQALADTGARDGSPAPPDRDRRPPRAALAHECEGTRRGTRDDELQNAPAARVEIATRGHESLTNPHSLPANGGMAKAALKSSR